MKKPNGWNQLQLRHLVALKAVADAGSFGGAAEELGYTQSAISHQIGVLERIVGAKLVERPGGRSPVSLTREGALLLAHAEAIVARTDAARADLGAFSNGGDVLRVGTYQSIAAPLLPDLLRELRRRRPALRVELHEGSSYSEPYELLEHGELDLAFAELPCPPGPFRAVELVHDPYVLVVAAGSVLAKPTAPLPLAQLAGLRLVGFRDCLCEERAFDLLDSIGIETTTPLRADDNSTIQGMVALGDMAAVVPRLTVTEDDAQTVVLALDEKLPPRTLGVVANSDREHSPAADDFTGIAVRLAARLQRRLDAVPEASRPERLARPSPIRSSTASG
jgi:DNA-binding transcriptional LysR family regulator